MTFPHKIFLTLIISGCFFNSNAAKITPDTTKRLPLAAPNNISSQFNDYMAYLKEGITSIRQDSVDKGIHLINVAMQHATAVKPITRIFDYRMLEVYQLLAIIDTSKLSLPEKQLGRAFLKSAFSAKDAQPEQSLNDYIKKSPNTVFTQRIKMLTLSYTDRRRMEDALDELLKASPKLITANILKAEMLCDDEEYSGAINYCNNVIAVWPQYAHAFHVRAKSYSHNSQYKEAIDDYNIAIKLYPQFILFDYDRAITLYDMENYKDAISGYLKVYAVSPDFRWVNYYLARCYKNVSMADSAFYYIDKHIKLNPDDGDGYNTKGDIYYDQDNYQKAVEFHNRAINLDNNNAGYYEDRGDDYYYLDQLDDAIKDYEKTLSIDKKRAYTNDRIGDAYYKKKEYEKGIVYHQTAIKIDPNYKYAYVGIYLCYSKLGKLKQSIEACQKAIAIDSTYSSALGNLGWAYYQDGKYDAAIEYSYKAIKYNEKATYAMFNIALATLRKGEYEKAKELYQQFINLCNEKKFTISDGAVEDLKDLIKQHIAENEATFIIKSMFKASL